MALKSAYREKPAAKISAEEIPELNIPPAAPDAGDDPAVAVDIRPEHEEGEPTEASREYEKQIAAADTAKNRLLEQVAALRQSEAMQRQHHAAMAAQQQAQPPTREQLLEVWKSQGMSESEAAFLKSNPELIDNHQLTAAAAAEAERQGHQSGSEAHMESTKRIFHQHLEHLKAQAEAAQPTPAFFQPPEAPAGSTPSPASYVSAPVSRGAVGGYREPNNPSKVKLSAEEKEIARNSGISEVTYAQNKLRLAREKASGERQ